MLARTGRGATTAAAGCGWRAAARDIRLRTKGHEIGGRLNYDATAMIVDCRVECAVLLVFLHTSGLSCSGTT